MAKLDTIECPTCDGRTYVRSEETAGRAFPRTVNVACEECKEQGVVAIENCSACGGAVCAACGDGYETRALTESEREARAEAAFEHRERLAATGRYIDDERAMARADYEYDAAIDRELMERP